MRAWAGSEPQVAALLWGPGNRRAARLARVGTGSLGPRPIALATVDPVPPVCRQPDFLWRYRVDHSLAATTTIQRPTRPFASRQADQDAPGSTPIFDVRCRWCSTGRVPARLLRVPYSEADQRKLASELKSFDQSVFDAPRQTGSRVAGCSPTSPAGSTQLSRRMPAAIRHL